MATKGSLIKSAAKTRDLFPEREKQWRKMIEDGRISAEEMTEVCRQLNRVLELVEKKAPEELVPDLYEAFSLYELIIASFKFSIDNTNELFNSFRNSSIITNN